MVSLVPLSVDHVLVGQEDQTYVGHHVDQVGGESLVKSPGALVSDNPVNTVPGPRVATLSVLQAGPHHLVGVGRQGSQQLGEYGECQIERRGDGRVNGLQQTSY